MVFWKATGHVRLFRNEIASSPETRLKTTLNHSTEFRRPGRSAPVCARGERRQKEPRLQLAVSIENSTSRVFESVS